MADTKRCPFCGEEIKSTAIKCKHCGEYLESKDSPAKQQTKIKWKPILKWVAGIYGFVILLALIVPSTPTETSDSIVPTNVETNNAQEDSSYNAETTSYDENIVTGSFSGFGRLANATSNYGGQLANCAQKGTGISLTEQLENFFNNDISKSWYSSLYELKIKNPNMRFIVENPQWAENAKYIYDIVFDNVNPNTLIPYSESQYSDPVLYPISDFYCGVLYEVYEQGGKYKVRLINVGCSLNEGYR